jgi:2-oxoglutarate ferredoxin oxidoreductase subunit alpha
MSQEAPPQDEREIESIASVRIRFAGDSGDGMQLAGARFTDASAIFGNDLSTLPNYPAEIRAPAGTLSGVSSFQVHIADRDILTPGDYPDVLVAMNPAALKANLADLAPAGTIVVNTDAFIERNLAKAGYEQNPLDDGSLDGYQVLAVPMEALTKDAVEGSGLKGRGVLRSKNFFALGLLAWMFNRPVEPTIGWIEKKFGRDEAVKSANLSAFRAGYHLGETTESFRHTYEVKPAELPPGTYTNVTGNQALAWGLIAAAQTVKLPLFYASYPITPASDILHELSRHRNFGVRTFQAEDEIAAVGAALGSSFVGHLGVTGTSGPGVALKSETISLGVITELPLIIVDVQRGGPSTGLPTKTEQADLLMALYGRHGEAPMPTPVLLLSDGYIGNGAEPWRIPDLDALPDFSVPFATVPNGEAFLPYLRDPETGSRPWAVPGTPGLEHRVGGLEKQNETGNVNYSGPNHELMTGLREQKIAGIARDIPDLEVDADEGADLLVLGWGSTAAAIHAAVRKVRVSGKKVARAHLRHLNPMPANTGEVLRSFDKILIPELNRGQLWRVLRGEFLIDSERLSKVQGQPFKAAEIEAKILEML